MTEQLLTKKQRKELHRQERAAARKAQDTTKRRRRLVGLAVTGLVLVGLVGLFIYVSNNRAPLAKPDTVMPGDNVKGATDGLLVVEYSDFQCPACAVYYPIVKQVMEEYSQQITFVYRHFPLRDNHPHAQLAAQAAQSAANQEKFWDMHDKLFANQNQWSGLNDPTAQFITYAQELNLDLERFKNDLSSQTVIDKVNQDYAGGLSAGVNSTPSFFINGAKLKAPSTLEGWRQILDLELNIAN